MDAGSQAPELAISGTGQPQAPEGKGIIPGSKRGRERWEEDKHQAGEVLWPRLPLTEARVVAGSEGHDAVLFSRD